MVALVRASPAMSNTWETIPPGSNADTGFAQFQFPHGQAFEQRGSTLRLEISQIFDASQTGQHLSVSTQSLLEFL
jgi:hypothetical protein